MKIQFKVSKQNIVRTDNEKVVADSRNYLKAVFSFETMEWQDKTVTAIFKNGKEVYHVLIGEDGTCVVPFEVIKSPSFHVSVFAGELVTADSAKVYVAQSGYADGGEPKDPTPDIYQQIIDKMDHLQAGEVTGEQIAEAVNDYLKEHPVSGVNKDEVEAVVSEYIAANVDKFKGEKGEPGEKGADGKDGYTPQKGIDYFDGKDGADGKSAYQSAVDHGFKGTEEEWLESMKGTGGTIDETVIAGAVSDYLQDNPISDNLSAKRILCVGDSICEGVGANEQPYAYWLQQWHPGAEVINLGVGGMTIAQKDASITNSMPVRIASGEFERAEYANIDIVVLEGGINDLMNNVKLGYISKGYAAIIYKTFCQGMEYMFSYFKSLYPKARMIFMSTHNVFAYDYNKSQAWWGAASEICAKWGVEFLDLFSLTCTPKIEGIQLHPAYDVHRDYYAKYLNMVLSSDTPLAGARTTHYYKHNVPMMLTYHSGTKQFNAGAAISTSDWRINMIRGDLTTYVNVSSNVTYDVSDVDITTEGTYPVHVAYTEDGITLSLDVDVTIVESGSTTKTLDSISATKSKTDFVVGDTVNTDDIVVTAKYTDGSSANVTSSASIDTSNANMTAAGEYNIAISYTENSVTKSTQIQISVSENTTDGGDSGADGGEEIVWDDSAQITGTWKATEGMFENITISDKYTQDATYNVSCQIMAESDSATSGEVVLRVGGSTHNLGTVTFGEVINVNAQMKANANWALGNLQTNVYTTSGSGFPWIVHIKDFAISE